MSVTVRPYRRGGWEVDIRLALPDGSGHRERRRAPVSGRSAAQRWGEARERELYSQFSNPAENLKIKEVPTLDTFAPCFLENYAQANQHKASGIHAKELILRVHLLPLLGGKRLDTITNESVQRVKAHLKVKSPKTVNNVLTVLNTLLKQALAWGVIDRLPCTIKLLKVLKGSVAFYDFDEYERLVAAAKAIDHRTYVLALLSGEAGLRSGEMVALEWSDVDLVKRLICVQRNAWEGQVSSPKGGRIRYVPTTTRLTAALREGRHLRGPRVLYRDNGEPFTEGAVTCAIVRAAPPRGAVGEWTPSSSAHVLFAFGDAWRRAASDSRARGPRAFHDDTALNMHLSPSALDRAIDLLETRNLEKFGDMLETRNI